MYILTSRHLRPFGVFLISAFLSACGSGGNSSAQPDTIGDSSSESPVVTIEGGDPNDTCDASVQNCDDNQSAASAVPLISPGAPVNGNVGARGSNLYRVPSDTQVVLKVNSGNAVLVLHNGIEASEDTIVCTALNGIGETSCTASADNGELYAQVYGRDASAYTISLTNDCSVPAINSWVDRNMRDYYLYSDQVPVVDPGVFESPEALISALRFETLDPYSSVRNAQTQLEFAEQGVTRAFGYSVIRDNDGLPRISLVYRNGPFGRAGITRGDIIVSINGELWDDLTNERYFELIGTSENPLSTTWVFIDGDTGETKSIVAQLEEFQINTVLHAQLITHPEYSGNIGYLVFRSFIEPSADELTSAFAFFKENGVTDLILDLRYNGGGRISIAQQLAGAIAGPATDDQLLVNYRYNDKYTAQNFSQSFASEANALGLTRLVAITSGATASASELVINGLKPYIDVTTVGSRTEGKSFISAANVYCGKSLNAMEAQGVNANGVSVAGGITADCFAADDVTRDFGVSNGVIEGMLRPAADYLVFGTCEAAPLTKQATFLKQAVEQPGEPEIYVNEH